MLGYHVNEATLIQAATTVGVRIIEYRHTSGTACRFRLGLEPDRKYGRTSASYFNMGRRVAAVCWHGHREFFRALFAIQPEARVQTAKTKTFAPGQRFYTADNFESIYRQSDGNIGSQLAPVNYSDACHCND
jgi:hypothetical protein